jgi:hypothetical protein
LDESFGNEGLVTTEFDDYNSGLNNISLQQDGKIVTAMRNYDLEYPWDTSYFAVGRYKASGIIDSSFANAGVQTTPLNGYAETSSIALQFDGKILVGGDVYDYSDVANYFAITRYLGDPQEKYMHIKKWLHHHGITWNDCPPSICNNLNYYSVQRSTNGSSFNEIARIFYRNQPQNSFEDPSPSAGTNYYRLAAVSTSNSVTYSNVVAVDADESSIKIYPNPATNTLHIEGLSSTQKTKLTIVDFTGNIKTIITVTGNSYNLNISQLKQGNYLLRIETNGSVVSKKILKE